MHFLPFSVPHSSKAVDFSAPFQEKEQVKFPVRISKKTDSLIGSENNLKKNFDNASFNRCGGDSTELD